MSTLQNKIDFAVVFKVVNANPNGDPLNGNRPRTTYDGLGELSDVCLKRKIRNRLMETGKSIFVQSDDNKLDKHPNWKQRSQSGQFSSDHQYSWRVSPRRLVPSMGRPASVTLV